MTERVPRGPRTVARRHGRGPTTPVAVAGAIVLAALGTGVTVRVASVLARTTAAAATAAQPGGGTHGISFELNQGQTSAAVRFVARGSGYPLYLTNDEAVFVLVNPSNQAGAAPPSRRAPAKPGPGQSSNRGGNAPATPAARPADAAVMAATTGAVVRMHLVGANPNVQISGEDQLPGVTNYFVGKDPRQWVRNVASYGEVRYHDVYPGVDLIYHANASGDGVEYDYVVAPGTDASTIAVDVLGADSVKSDGTGALAVNTAAGQLLERRPQIYQDVDGSRRVVSGGYKIAGGNRVGFTVGPHDPTKPVVVDPQLSYLTYLGGTLGQDQAMPALGIAVDAAGSAYSAGKTFAPDYPTTTGAFQTTKFGDPTKPSFLNIYNAFITKMSPDGSSLEYSTYLGGTGQGFFTGDEAVAIALDSKNDAFVTGDTSSPDFPTTPNAFQPAKPSTCSTCTNAFVSEIDPTGSHLVFSTYVGGSTADNGLNGKSTGEGGKSIAVDGSGKVDIAGVANSLDFPVTPTAFQKGCIADCPTLTDGASTLGSASFTSASAFFTSDDVNQPITGTNIPANTVIQSVDSTTSVTLGDGNGTAVTATGTGSGLAFTVGGRTFNAAFVARLDPAASGAASLAYSTLLGTGNSENVANGISLDAGGHAYIAGLTNAFDFPATGGAFQTTCGNCNTKIDGTTVAASSTFVSLSAHFSPFDVGASLEGTDIVPGSSIATVVDAHTVTLSSPATATGTGLRYVEGRGNPTAFVAKVDLTKSGGASLVYATFLGGFSRLRAFSSGDRATGVAVDPATGRAYVTGSTTSGDFPTTPGAYDRACNGGGPGNCGNEPTFPDGTSTNGSTTYRSASASFDEFDSGVNLVGFGIPPGTFVQQVVSSTTILLSSPATATGTGPFTIGGDRGGSDAFVSELSPSGSSIIASTYVGGPEDDASAAIALDGAGHVHIAGSTSPGRKTNVSGYPTADPVAAFGGGAPLLPSTVTAESDATVSELDAGLMSLRFSTTLGGGDVDVADAIAVDAAGAEYVSGNTRSSDLPTTPGAFETTFGGLQSAWVAKISPVGLSVPLVLGISPRHGPIIGGTTVTVTGRGFSGVTGVTVGGVAAPFHVDSPTQITAVSPPLAEGTAYADVVVTTTAGSSPANPIDRFTVGDGLWSSTGSIDADRNGPTATLLASGKVLVVGGATPDQIGNPPTLPAEIFDPRSGTWSAAATPPFPMAHHEATLLNDGRVLVVGDQTGGFGPPVAELYDPAANAWTTAATPGNNHTYGTTTLLASGQVLAVGGRDGPVAEVYDPTANTWTTVGAPATGFAFLGQTATLLQNGQVLVAGGCCSSSGGVRSDAELYDPLRRAWTATGSMGADRLGHTATLLANGDVMVAGGAPHTLDAYALGSEEVYHPSTGTWTLVGLLHQPTVGGAAAMLPDGRVLLAGGTVDQFVNFAEPLSAAEIFDPANPGGQATADRMNAGRGEWNGGFGGSSLALVLLSSDAHAFKADPAICGGNCGKILAVGGSYDTSTELYTPPPAVTGISPSRGTAAGGTAVTITGAGFNNLETPTVTFGGIPAASVRVDSYSQITAVTRATSAGTVDVVVRSAAGQSATTAADAFTFTPMPVPVPIPAAAGGYWLVAADGGIFPFGSAGGFGSTGGVRLNKPIVGMAATPDGGGYWLVAADGGVFPFGDAVGHGSTGAIRLNKPIVGMASTPDGGGYWLVASDGGVFPFGDAVGRGSTGAIRLNKPVVGMSATPDGGGYWLVAADGGIFPFGDAAGHGSTGAIRLNKPMVGMAATRDGGGYWLVASDGGIFPFGDATGLGSTGGTTLNQPVVDMAAKG